MLAGTTRSTASSLQQQCRSLSWTNVVSYGQGGRSSVSGVCATVFGATGFLGRYVVNELGRVGSQVVVPYRGNDTEWRHLKLMGDLGQVVPLKWDARDRASIERAVQHSNVVINLIGSKYSSRNWSLDDSNRKIARLVARVSKEQGVERLVHVSDLGADLQSPSEYARLKAIAEQEVREIFPQATCVRPAPMYGPEDRISNFYASLMRLKIMAPVVAPKHRIQPVYAPDVAAGILATIGNAHTQGRVVELAGPDIFTQAEFADLISQMLLRPDARAIGINPKFAEPVAAILDRLPKHRPRVCLQDVQMRRGKDLVESGDPANYTFSSLNVASLEAFRSVALLWLRRFRDVPFMNQVVGEDTFIHDYEQVAALTEKDVKKW